MITNQQKNLYSHPHLTHLLPLIFHETIPNSFQLLQTPSKLIGQNLMSIGHFFAEIMRDMTPQTKDKNHTYPLFFFYRGVKNLFN
jgi:hypothetical protein